MKWAFLAVLLLTACQPAPQVEAELPPGVQTSRFSHKPVPRFEVLKHAKVNGRIGPSEDYRVQWQYTRKGLPVLIVKESGEWRFVRDPMGDEVWINGSQLTSRPGALTQAPFVLRAGRAGDSAEVAHVDAGVLVDLGECDAEACEITAGRYRGWAPRGHLWGASATKG